MYKNIKEVVLSIKKTTFVRAGGRNFQFSVMSLISLNEKFGFGKGKSKILNTAIKKSFKNAEKFLFEKSFLKNSKYYFKGKHCGSILEIIPNENNVLRAGGVVRKILKTIKVKNLIFRNIGSNNVYNIIEVIKKYLFFIKKYENK